MLIGVNMVPSTGFSIEEYALREAFSLELIKVSISTSSALKSREKPSK